MPKTIAEDLRNALSSIRKKKRAAVRYDTQAYRKAYGIKGGNNGNSRSRSKGKAPTAPSTDGSIAEVGRSPGVIGEGGQAVN